MKITLITDEIKDLFEKCLISNELDGDTSLIYKFSLCKANSKSGYSFGITQLDCNNNAYALLALKEMNFTTVNIQALRDKKVVSLASFSARLLACKEIVDKYDLKQIEECLNASETLCNETLAELSSLETFLHICDYSNQIGFSRGGRLYNFLINCYKKGVEVTPKMIMDFKLSIRWGRENPKDVYRRFTNVEKVYRESATVVKQQTMTVASHSVDLSSSTVALEDEKKESEIVPVKEVTKSNMSIVDSIKGKVLNFIVARVFGFISKKLDNRKTIIGGVSYFFCGVLGVLRYMFPDVVNATVPTTVDEILKNFGAGMTIIGGAHKIVKLTTANTVQANAIQEHTEMLKTAADMQQKEIDVTNVPTATLTKSIDQQSGMDRSSDKDF